MHDEITNTDSNKTKEAAAPLNFEPDDFRHHLNDFDLTKDQQNELLASLWSIMSTLVDIGWGVDTIQLLLPELFKDVALDSEKLLESKNTSKFDQITDTHER